MKNRYFQNVSILNMIEFEDYEVCEYFKLNDESEVTDEERDEYADVLAEEFINEIGVSAYYNDNIVEREV